MSNIAISIQDKNGKLLATDNGNYRVNLVYTAKYKKGDTITLTAKPGSFLVIQLDDVLEPSFVYMKGANYTMTIPFGEARLAYNPKTFSGDVHLLKARLAEQCEIESRKNLAFNSHDTTSAKDVCFPHVFANNETVGMSVFAARNAIDGNTENRSHCNWPYESWDINSDPNAELTLEFGRAVKMDKLVLIPRADFPHDNYWQQVAVTFIAPDGTEQSRTLNMEKSYSPQEWNFATAPKTITALKLGKIKNDKRESSKISALTQIEVWGTEAE
ncbi:MAG: carbohydrate-binding protein [Spirochaetaceae bacterium]|nr:carbohydrate-binding protein [Spirochaetaceae bacterium]